MKIKDVKITAWEWQDIPATRYTLRVVGHKARSTHVALVQIITDEELKGTLL